MHVDVTDAGNTLAQFQRQAGNPRASASALRQARRLGITLAWRAVPPLSPFIAFLFPP